MPHGSTAMRPSSYCLRSLLHFSRRLHLHLHQLRLPPPLSTHFRRISSSSSGGAGWASYDPLSDRLISSASASAVAASASNSETSADSDVWGVYDPVAGRVIMQPLAPPPPSSSSDDEEEKGQEKKDKYEGKEEEEEEDEEMEKGKSSGGVGRTMWSALAAGRRGRGKAAKERVSYVCQNCGESSSQWWGTCRQCKAVGTVTRFMAEPATAAAEASWTRGTDVSEHALRSWFPQKSGEMVPRNLSEVNKGVDQAEWRIPLSGNFGMEISRVLGGGIVPGSLVLVGGDPGVGKSSLLLQLASVVAEGFKVEEPSPVVYVSGEESIEQIGNRADRMRIQSRKLYLYSSTDIEDILDKIQPLSPGALIIDSIQTVYLRGFAGSAGNATQVKECTSALLRFAKQTNIPVFLIGHVTKTGDIAGPRILEHIVDVVLYMEGERCSTYRLLRSVKNRFGSTDELGVFEMSESGLQTVLNPSEMFLTEHDSDSEILAGLAVAVILDGSRTFAIEVQALCVSGSPRNGEVVGIPTSRADVIISVLMKQAGLKLQDNAIFLNVVSGFKLTETAGDLAIAASICSSFLEFPIPNDVAFIGEIGLGGELRTVPRMDKRVIAIAKLGYKKCVVPKISAKLLKPLNLDIEVLPCSNLKEVINTIFRPQG